MTVANTLTCAVEIDDNDCSCITNPWESKCGEGEATNLACACADIGIRVQTGNPLPG